MNNNQLTEREDDEYHTPTKHHVHVTISKDGGPKEYRKATITAKEPDHAVNTALKHYKSQGYTVHDHKYLGEDVQIEEGTGNLKPGWMLKQDPALAKKLKDQQDRKKFVAGEPTKKEVKENAPVAPVPDKKYIKGTPENKAYKATKKPINGMPTNKMKEETMPQSFKGFLTSLTELTDKQKKHIDKNNNGKIDGHDFKLLRKEDDMGEDSHQSKTTMKHIPNASPALKKAAKDIKPGVSGYRDRIAMLKAGGVKEEVELVNESHFDVGDSVVCKDSKTKGKVVKVDPKEEGKYYTVKHADGKMVKYSPDELKLENYYMEELDEALDPSEVAGNPKMYDAATVKKAYYHKKTTPEDKKTLERHLDRHHGQHDWRNSVKEDLDQIEEKSDQAKQNKTMKNMMDASRGAKFKLNNPVPEADPQHKTAQAHNKAIGRALRNESTKAEDPPFDGPYKKTSGDGSVKDKSGAVHTPMSRARDLARKAMQQKMKEDFNLEITEEQAADLCDIATINEKMDMSKADMGDVIKDFKKSDAPQFAGKSDEKRRQMAIAAKLQADREMKEETTVKSYSEFVTEIKMADLPSRKVKGTSYGAQYHDPEGDDDAEERKPKAAKPADAPKRGRGRPSGSKSGAKQQGSEKSSNYGGIDRTTYALRLPNNNK